MKRTMTAAAALLLATGTAFAQDNMSSMRTEMHNSTAADAMSTEELRNSQGKLIRTRDITGGEVYTVNEADDEGWDPTMNYNAVDSGWNEIGEIEDIVLSSDGKMTGIIAEVGGFLDIGDKHVLISVSDLNLVAVDDRTYAYVTRLNEEQLEELPDVDEGFWN